MDSSSSSSQLRIAGAWSGALDVHLDTWTLSMLRDEVRRRSAAAGSAVNLICEGRALKDRDDGQFLVQLGLEDNSKVLASVASPDKGEALDEAPASEAERSSELSRPKAAAVALAERHTDSGSLPIEDFDKELEDQSGQKLQVGSETDHRGAMMGVMPHTKGKRLIEKEKINDALEVLTMAEVSHEVTNRVPHHEIVEPYKGMDFKTQEDVYSYYKKYARSYGFGVSIKASRRSKKTNEFIDVKYACTRHGEKRKLDAIHPRPCLKIGCRAMLHAKRIEDEKWVVHEFIKDHNHELSPMYAHYLPYHRGITSSQKHDVSTLQAVGVGVSKIYAAMAKQQGGYDKIGCLEKDIKNLVEKEKRLSLQSGDANAIMEFFMHMKEKDPEFFFAIDWDEQHRLRNVFWVHGNGRRNYQNFSDVVSFDTIYITSRYQMPLAPFIGVNNHFQPIILGCALLADESTSTFVWLMRTWLTAMGGKTPNVILTDQDKAMKAAIRLVFPNAKHCYCLWHIMRKLPEKLSHVINKHEKFMETFQRCIYRSWTKEQFEERWFSMVDDFELIEDPLLQSLFEEREYWVPAHMRDTFFAGMSTSQRSESINSFFDKYVNKMTVLKGFIEKYVMALEDSEEAERHANFNTWHKEPAVKTPSLFERQMSGIYTHELFKKFQVEVLGVSGCHATKEKDGVVAIYRVEDFEKEEDFYVSWDANEKIVSCLCRSYEYNGFLCRHSLCVLHHCGIFHVPSHYILERWTRDFIGNGEKRKVVDCRQDRYDDLFRQATMLCKEGSNCQESYNIASHALRVALDKCKMYKSNTDKDDTNCVDGGTPILDPEVVKTKGAKRMKSKTDKKCKEKNNKDKKEVQSLRKVATSRKRAFAAIGG